MRHSVDFGLSAIAMTQVISCHLSDCLDLFGTIAYMQAQSGPSMPRYYSVTVL
jgi:hypothetical protein